MIFPLGGCHHLAVTTFYHGLLPGCSYSFVTKRVAEKSRYFRGARLAAHNERRHPAELARSCASKPHWGFDCFATAQSRLKGAWVRALRERFASAPLRIQERTDWPLPGANALRLDGSRFLLFVAYFRSFVGGGVLDAPMAPLEDRLPRYGGGGTKCQKGNVPAIAGEGWLL